MESVGFKEWAIVCEALGRGRQSIILRKGGIAEGRDGFSFKYNEFFLFPTWFHEQPQKVRESFRLPGENDDTIEIKYAAQIDAVCTITSFETAQALEPLHILQPDVVRERFDYDDAPGLQVALVRVLRLGPTWNFPNEPRYGGCRSWVKLPDPGNLSLEPVITDDEHAHRRQEFLAITGVAKIGCSGGL